MQIQIALVWSVGITAHLTSGFNELSLIRVATNKIIDVAEPTAHDDMALAVDNPLGEFLRPLGLEIIPVRDLQATALTPLLDAIGLDIHLVNLGQ